MFATLTRNFATYLKRKLNRFGRSKSLIYNDFVDAETKLPILYQPKKYRSMSQSLYDRHGDRLYLNASERQVFIDEAHKLLPLERVFCLMLVYTGCRLSEARNLRKRDLQLSENKISIRTLKRRNGQPVREVPIPATFSLMLKIIYEGERAPRGEYLWSAAGRPLARITCYRLVKEVMYTCGLEGIKATPRGLRHTFAANAMLSGIQLNMLQKWMGHASIQSTTRYATVSGPEEQQIAERMWS